MMTERPSLVNQPTYRPTRKMWAVMFSSAAVATARFFIERYAPALNSLEFYFLMENIVSVVIIALAGYMTKEYANASVPDGDASLRS